MSHVNVYVLEDDVEVLEDDVEVLEDDVGVLEDDVEVLEDDVEVLEDDVEVLEDDAAGEAKRAKEDAMVGAFERLLGAVASNGGRVTHDKLMFGGRCAWVGGEPGHGGCMLGGITKDLNVCLRTDKSLAALMEAEGATPMNGAHQPWRMVGQDVFYNGDNALTWVNMALDVCAQAPPPKAKAKTTKRKKKKKKKKKKAQTKPKAETKPRPPTPRRSVKSEPTSLKKRKSTFPGVGRTTTANKAVKLQ